MDNLRHDSSMDELGECARVEPPWSFEMGRKEADIIGILDVIWYHGCGER